MAKTKEEKREYMRKWRAENAEKIKTHNAKYRAKNSEKTKASKAKWNRNNAEKIKTHNAKYRAKNTENIKTSNAKATSSLASHYVKRTLVSQGFKNEQITPELIELKRITLKTTRLCRQLKN